MKYLFIDLFAGLGGASSAFVKHEDFEVMQFDNNPELIQENPGLIIGDVLEYCDIYYQILRKMTIYQFEKVVLWASPPCLEFSTGYSAPRNVAERAGQPYAPDMSCLLGAIRFRDRLALDCLQQNIEFTWFIENVRGATTHFEPFLGRYRQQIGSFFLWGNFPPITLMSNQRGHTKPDDRHSPIRSNIRAKIPLEYSQACLESVLHSVRLTSYLSHQGRD